MYRAHADAVYSFFAYSVTDSVAEDLTSSTFERVVRAWRSYDARRASERTWILTIARNLLTDHYRRQSLRTAASIDEKPALVDYLIDSDDPFARVLGPGELRDWLECLDERQRQVLALRYGGDLSTTDIAAMLELSPANVHQILSRSLRRLRQEAEAAAGQRQRSTVRSARRS